MRGRRSTSSVARDLCPGAGAVEANPTVPDAFARVEGLEALRRAMIATAEIETYLWQLPGETGEAMALLLSGAHASLSEGRLRLAQYRHHARDARDRAEDTTRRGRSHRTSAISPGTL
jgi:hypothetical protein